MNIRSFAVAALLGGGLLAGCSSAPAVKAEAPKPVKPEWVTKGSGAYSGDAATVFYGLGVANAMPNIALQRKMADQRGREEVAATLKTSLKSMVKDYMDHHVDYFKAEDTAGSDEFSSYVSKSVVDAELMDSRVVDHWDDPDTGALYALVRMDSGSHLYDQYKDTLKQALRDAHGAALKARTEDAIKDLDKAVADERGREKEILGATDPAPKAAAPAAPAQ